MESKVESRVLEGAIVLFAEYGFFGVTIRDLAKKGNTNLHAIYRLFGGKNEVFDAALDAVIGRLADPAQLALMMFQNKNKQDSLMLIRAVAMRWYESLSSQSARLLMQAYLSKNDRWKNRAYAYLDAITDILAGSMEPETGAARDHFDPAMAARSLILALFQFKILEAPARPAKEEAEAVEGIVRQCLRGLATSLPGASVAFGAR